ncbi:MAG: hypothetical protein KBA75_05220 [Alphaproteobacteria bacterium]|nr:hypothetical protein [Alphaproteobacteria bacterium]
MQDEQDSPLDWDEGEKKRPSGLSVLGRVIATLIGIGLIIGVMIFAFFIIACSQLGGGTRTAYGLSIPDAVRAMAMLVPGSVLGLVLVEFGATGRTSPLRYWIGGLSLLSLVLVVLFGLPYGLR